MKIPVMVYERIDHLRGRATPTNWYVAAAGAWIEHHRGQSYLVSVV